MKTCFFIGHRDAPPALAGALAAAVERHITVCGVTDFTVGHYGAFDRMAASAVMAAKKRRPEVTLSLLLPYHPSEQPVRVPEGFDGTFYPPGMETAPRRFAIVRANRYLVEHSDFLIAYVWHAASSARELLELAHRRKEKGLLPICNLGEG